MDIQTLIHHNLDELMYLADKKGVLDTVVVVEIGAYVAAAVLRGRFSSIKEVSEQEINGVFGIIGDFCKLSFGRSFTKVHYRKMTAQALKLIQEPTFDQDLEMYMAKMRG